MKTPYEMMTVRYDIAFDLLWESPFYENGISAGSVLAEPDFEMVPDPPTAALMRRLDMIMKPNYATGGMIVFVRVLGQNSSGDDLVRFAVRPNDRLVFLVKLKNTAALHFNDLPLHNRNEIFYFTNADKDPLIPRTALSLSANPSAVSPADSIKAFDGNYHYEHTGPVLPDTAVIKHKIMGEVIRPNLLVNTGGTGKLDFVLSGTPGLYELSINNVVHDRFYFLPQLNEGAVFGVIELLLSSSLSSNWRIIEPDRSLTSVRPHHVVVVHNRPVVWRYRVGLEPSSPVFLEMQAMTPADRATFISHMNIVSNDTAVSFTNAGFSNGAFVFHSDANILLRQRYLSSTAPPNTPLVLDLKKNIGQPGEKIIRSHLPFPSFELIDTRNAPVIYSDIYLTI